MYICRIPQKPAVPSFAFSFEVQAMRKSSLADFERRPNFASIPDYATFFEFAAQQDILQVFDSFRMGDLFQASVSLVSGVSCI